MKTTEAIEYAGSAIALARMIGVTSGAISQWGETVPDAKQLLLQRLTNGALVAASGCLDRVIGIDKLPTASLNSLSPACTNGGVTPAPPACVCAPAAVAQQPGAFCNP